MANMAAPQDLHIHELYEGEPARISWDKVVNAGGYILERQFNETFEQASKGFNWLSIDAKNKQWDEIEQDELSWGELESLPTLGKTWEDIDYTAYSWNEIDTKDFSWDEWALQPMSFEIFRGSGTMEIGNTWTEWEDDGYGDWDQIDAGNKTWDMLEGVEKHISLKI